MMENITINIGTLFHCDKLYEYEEAQTFDPLWTQTVKGCRIVQLLQEMYRFNISYVMQNMNSTRTTRSTKVPYDVFDNVDIHTRPMRLESDTMRYSYPVQAIYNWKFGFIFRRPEDNNYLRMFYSKPFTRPLWNCLYGMAVFISIIFYILQIWEKHIVGAVNESGITYVMLMVMGSYCQHIPPLHAALSSRRTAYFVFLIFTYIIYSFYTSNLLSHLVNDRTDGMDLETLTKSNYNYVVTHGTKLFLEYSSALSNKNLSLMNTLAHFKSVPTANGLRQVNEGKTALLSDFTSLDPYMTMTFQPNDLCELVRIDLVSNVKKFIFTSKNFMFKEQIKIGTLRAKEVGIFRRLINVGIKPMVNCEPPKLFQTTIIQIFTPLSTLLLSYVLSLLILAAERYHFQRYRLFPYID